MCVCVCLCERRARHPPLARAKQKQHSYLAPPRQHSADVVTTGSLLVRGIKPGRADVTKVGMCRLPRGVEQRTIFAFTPHMHRHGRRISATLLEPTGALDASPHYRIKAELAANRTFDFNRQETIVLDEPLLWRSEDVFIVHCSYDTRGETKPLAFGQSTSDEMCFVWVFFYDRIPKFNLCLTGVSEGYYNHELLRVGQLKEQGIE
jgi:hypothetical protein